MKLNCQIDLLRRLQPGRKGKYCLASLSICKKLDKSSNPFYLMISTVKNHSWQKYKISNNIEIFSKFAHEGKCTIRILEPPHDILIQKAEVIQLKSFLSILNLTKHGKNVEEIHFSQPPTQVIKPKTKMEITSRKDYPHQGFPVTLVSLQLSNIRLCAIPKAILKLVNLEALTLSNNVIKESNISLASLKNLSVLNLSRNKLKSIDGLEIEKLPKLSFLDASHNEISILNNSLCSCLSLKYLNLSNNKITELPQKIGNLSSLRNLILEENQIIALPESFLKLQLNVVDLFSNPLEQDGFIIDNKSTEVSSLLILAASVVASNGTKYTPEDLPIHLIKLVENMSFCRCGKPLLPTAQYSIFFKKDIAQSFILPLGFHRAAPFQAKLCSLTCYF